MTATTWPPNPPLVDGPERPRGVVEYRGSLIDAGRLEDGTWVTVLDGEEIRGNAPSYDDAIRRGKKSVNRRLGREPVAKTRATGDDSYFDRLRDEIRG